MNIAPTIATTMRLYQLSPHTCAVIRRIESGSEEIRRLQSLGVCVGRQIEIIKSGDPLIVRVFGSHLGVAASLAAHVWLEVCKPSHCAFKENTGI